MPCSRKILEKKMIIKKLTVSEVKEMPVGNSGAAAKIARDLILKNDFHKEHLIVLYVNRKNKINSAEVVHIGTLSSCVISPSAIFKTAILSDAASIVVLHNHPSGDVEPSKDDIQVYRDLKKAGKILDINVLDSIVFNEKGSNYSMEFDI